MSLQSSLMEQISVIHFQPFRVSQSVIDLKEKFLQLVNDQNKFCSIENNYSFEQNLITKFLNSNENRISKKILEQMWKTSQFCDLLFIVQGNEYLAHRYILAENSHKLK